LALQRTANLHLASGEVNKEIAIILSISENTAKVHVRNSLTKLHFENRVQAAAYALRHGLVPAGGETDGK
jgi:DNA-binding NarL/FixJ family response regulator